jgi:predicted transcriptional regulator
MTTTLRDKVFTTLVLNGEQKTLRQLSAQTGATASTVSSCISDIRDDGYVIYSNKRTDSRGRVKYFYRHGAPSRSMLRTARLNEKIVKSVLG